MLRSALAIALVAVAQVNAETLMWNGRALDMASPNNVRVVDADNERLGAAVDLTKAATFTTIEFGNPGSDAAVELRATNTFNMGKKIVFTGKTKIILGTSKPGSKAKLSFAAPVAGTPEDAKVAFVPGSSYAAWDKSAASEFMCHKNWVVWKDGEFQLPMTEDGKFRGPCSGDVLAFPVNKKRYDPAAPETWTSVASDSLNSFYAATAASDVAFDKIMVGIGGEEYDSCSEFVAASTSVKIDCDKFKMGQTTAGVGTCSSMCLPHVEVHESTEDGTDLASYIQPIDTDVAGSTGDFHVEGDGSVLASADKTGPKYKVGLAGKGSGKITVTVTDVDSGDKLIFDPNTYDENEPTMVVLATDQPTAQPTTQPTAQPTTQPTTQPSTGPTQAPTDPTSMQTTEPTKPGETSRPTDAPTLGKQIDTSGTADIEIINDNVVSVNTAEEATKVNTAAASAKAVDATEDDKDKLVAAVTNFVTKADKSLPQSANDDVVTAVSTEQKDADDAKATLTATNAELKSANVDDEDYAKLVDAVISANQNYKNKQVALSDAITKANKDPAIGASKDTTDEKDGDDDSSSSSTVIIAVVIVVVVLVAAIAVVVVMKSSGGGGSGGDGQRAVVSFENPMYDTVKQGQGGAPPPPAEGFYAEPGADATSGYQDVGPNNDGFDGAQGSTGYMDVGGMGDGGGAGEGYMDVAPNQQTGGYMDVGGADNYDDDGEEDV